jgi:1-acyl-sn-glycerol-3-phosphate acyltransferase
LPFKKGGFHIALNSGFPIVPIAIRGSMDIMKKGKFRIYPGTIEVEIFPPIETDIYSSNNVNELIEKIRKIIEEGVDKNRDPRITVHSP